MATVIIVEPQISQEENEKQKERVKLVMEEIARYERRKREE